MILCLYVKDIYLNFLLLMEAVHPHQCWEELSDFAWVEAEL